MKDTQDLSWAEALREVDRLRAELESEKEKSLRIVRGEFNQICSYCGWESDSDAPWAALQSHIHECTKHPVYSLRAENEKLKTDYDSAAMQAAERMSQECQLLRAELAKQRALYITEFDRAEKLERDLKDSFEDGWGWKPRAEAAEVKVKELENKFKQLHKDLGHELRDPSGTIWEEAARLQKELTKQRALYLAEFDRAEKLERELEDARQDTNTWKARFKQRGYSMEEHAKALERAEAAEAENRAILQRNAELIEERDQYKLALSGKTMCYGHDSYVKGMEEAAKLVLGLYEGQTSGGDYANGKLRAYDTAHDEICDRIKEIKG